MHFKRSIFLDYFEKRISKETLIKELNMESELFFNNLLSDLELNYHLKDSEMIEFLIYALLLWEEYNYFENAIHLHGFEDILNALLISDWHMQHETIVLILQKIQDKKSLEYIYKAIHLKLEYLEWDENFSFQVKCIRAIGRIGGKEAVEYLEILRNDSNQIIAHVAQRQFEKMM